jgi:transposase
VRNWTYRHAEWLATQRFTNPHDEFVFTEMQHHLNECSDRLERLEQAVSQAVMGSPLEPAIRALQCLKGFREVGAATVCAELGDITRFYTPRELMGYTGLVPGVASSGDHTTLYGITKVGNAHLRRILVEAAWAYRYRPHVGQELTRRQRGQPPEILRVSWKAQTRLNDRYRHLRGRGKDVRKVITAVARELVGFVWEVLQHVPPAATQPAA